LVGKLGPRYGRWLSRNPALEDVARVTQAVAKRLAERKVLAVAEADALELRESLPRRVVSAAAEALGAERKTSAGEVLQALEKRRTDLWVGRIHEKINWELFDRGVEAFTWAALEEVGRAARGRNLLKDAPHGEEC